MPVLGLIFLRHATTRYHLVKAEAEIAKTESWREKEQTQAAVKTFIHDYLYDENTGLPVETYTDEEVESWRRIFSAMCCNNIRARMSMSLCRNSLAIQRNPFR